MGLILALLLSQPASLNLNQTPINVKDEGTTQGTYRAHTINCTGTGVTCTNGAGTMTLNVTGGGGGAPTTAQYLTLLNDATLTAERVLTGTANRITLTDNGANSTLVLSTPQDLHTAANPTWANTTLTGYLDLTTISEPAAPSGAARLHAQSVNGKTVLEFSGPDGIDQQLARDNYALGYNNTGGVLGAYSVVYFSGGSTGGTPHMDLARANSATTMPAIGVLVESTAIGAVGRVMVQGRLTGLNLGAFSGGDRLYVSSSVAGSFTTTPPPHPNLRQRFAIIAAAVAAPNGTVDVVPAAVLGEGFGTNENDWMVGSATAGAKTVTWSNGQLGALSWNPTGTRTITIPDATGTMALTPLTTKGDLYTFTTVDARKAVGTDGLCLKALAADPTGLTWDTCAAGGSGLTHPETMTRINFGGF